MATMIIRAVFYRIQVQVMVTNNNVNFYNIYVYIIMYLDLKTTSWYLLTWFFPKGLWNLVAFLVEIENPVYQQAD